jgi:hypothetical protein
MWGEREGKERWGGRKAGKDDGVDGNLRTWEKY